MQYLGVADYVWLTSSLICHHTWDILLLCWTYIMIIDIHHITLHLTLLLWCRWVKIYASGVTTELIEWFSSRFFILPLWRMSCDIVIISIILFPNDDKSTFGWGNGLAPWGDKPLPKSILTKSHDILRRHKRATISRWLHFVSLACDFRRAIVAWLCTCRDSNAVVVGVAAWRFDCR